MRLRLGLTALPFVPTTRRLRRSAHARAAGWGVGEQIRPDPCVEPSDLIAAGMCAPESSGRLGGHSREGQPDRDVSLSAEQRESWRARNLRRAIRLADSSSIASRC